MFCSYQHVHLIHEFYSKLHHIITSGGLCGGVRTIIQQKDIPYVNNQESFTADVAS